MKLLVTGGHGQLGRGLARRGAACGIDVIALPRTTLDVTDAASIAAALAGHAPEAVIHAAAFTHVDRAETERERAEAVNARGAELVARACAERGIPLWYVSTDHVFDGGAARAYREDDPIAPVNAYGATKAAGERAVRAMGGTVVRTAWLFGPGGPSFVHAIARRARAEAVLRVVADQHGSPTYVDDLADALLQLARERPRADVVHVAGVEPVSRHAFAAAIVEALRPRAAVACTRIVAIASSELAAPARRPAYAALDTARARALGLPIRPWRDGLRALAAGELGER